jgi:hypothetical protein
MPTDTAATRQLLEELAQKTQAYLGARDKVSPPEEQVTRDALHATLLKVRAHLAPEEAIPLSEVPVHNPAHFHVFERPCQECLFGEERIVDPQRKKQIIKDLTQKGGHFICHRATMDRGKDVACAAWAEKMGGTSNLYRISQRLGKVKLVKLPED